MSVQRKVLLVEDELPIRFGMRRFLEKRGFEVEEASSCDAAWRALVESPPLAAVLDYRLPDGTALDLLDRLREADLVVPAVILTGHGTIDLAVQAMQRGASNFFTKPVELSALASLLEELARSGTAAAEGGSPEAEAAPVGRSVAPDPFCGTSRAVRSLAERARKIAAADSPVLLLGETGVGKGVLARWLHRRGPRRDRPFVDLNCGGLSRDLLESELFGYRAGAFTGAVGQKPGLFEAADGGVVLLDEIGDTDPRVQAKVLKVIEERSFRRLGEVRERSVDFRLVSATHWNLHERIRSGEFRKDLYYRISILPLVIPPLRKRLEDLPALTRSLLDGIGARIGGGPYELTPEAADILRRHTWPGNVRELRNVLERAVLLSEGRRIAVAEIHFDEAVAPSSAAAPASMTLLESEIRHIERVLRAVGGSVSEAAQRLDVPRSSLYQKIKKYGLRTSDASASGA